MPKQKRQSDRLLNEAALAFARLGYAGASVRAIADAANINGAMVSYYFDSKEGLFRAVLEDRDARIRERLTWSEKAAGPGQALPEVRRRAYLNCALVEFPEFLHLLLSHALLAGDSFPNKECRQLAAEHTKLLDAPDLLRDIAVELLTSPASLIDQPEPKRQALANKLAPASKPRRQSNKSRATESRPPESTDSRTQPAPAPHVPPPKPAGDDFLDGFVD